MNSLTYPPSNAAAVFHWRQLAAELRHPDIELTVEEFAPVFSAFSALTKTGYPLDPMLVTLMDALLRQAVQCDDGDPEIDELELREFDPLELTEFDPLELWEGDSGTSAGDGRQVYDIASEVAPIVPGGFTLPAHYRPQGEKGAA